MISCLFVGIIMGDMSTAISTGIAIQLVYIGVMAVGMVAPADQAVATLVGCSMAVVLVRTMPLEEAVAAGLAVAVTVGPPATAFTQLVRTMDTIFNEYSKNAALRGDVKAQRLWQWVPNQVVNLLVWTPMITLVTFAMGSPGFLNTMNEFLGPVARHLAVMAGVLPAVGIALALRRILNVSTMPFLLIGFAITSYLNLPLMAVAIMATCVAALIALADIQKRREQKSAAAAIDNIEDI